jgi:predicted Zn-dependent peptidase
MKNYELTKLPNGLRVLTVPMKGRQSCGVAVWIRTGARYESSQEAGISHFLEHMLFKGTTSRNAQQIKQAVEGVGGSMNAFTGEEMTCYFAKLLKLQMPVAMEVLADMVLNSTFPEAEVEKERCVILEEIKMYKDLPSHEAHEKMSSLLWPKHSLGRPIAGTQESVTGLKRTDLVNYQERYYGPANMLVSVAGDVRHQDVLKQVKKHFNFRGKVKASSFDKASFLREGQRIWIKKKKIEQTHLVLAFQGLARVHPDRYKLSLLHVMLGANMSSRLFEEVREKRGLAYEIKSGLVSYIDTGAFIVSAGVEAKKAPECIRVVLNELRQISKQPPSAEELKRAKDFFMSQICMGVEDTLDNLLWAGDRVISGRNVPDLIKIRKNIQSVTSEQISAVAKQLFQSSKLYFTAVGPISDSLKSQMQKALKWES